MSTPNTPAKPAKLLEPNHSVKQTAFMGLALAGGQSTRMGAQNKALVAYQNKPLLLHTLDGGLKHAAIKLVSVGPHTYKQPCFEPYTHLPDDGTQGPLAGIYQGLLALKQHPTLEWLAVMPCDTPNVPSDWIWPLLAHASGQQALYVCHNQRHHFAHSLWRQSTLAVVQAALCNNQLALKHQLTALNAQAVDLTAYTHANSFANINTPQALA